jgi:hypothetical protein
MDDRQIIFLDQIEANYTYIPMSSMERAHTDALTNIIGVAIYGIIGMFCSTGNGCHIPNCVKKDEINNLNNCFNRAISYIYNGLESRKTKASQKSFGKSHKKISRSETKSNPKIVKYYSSYYYSTILLILIFTQIVINDF